LTQIAQEKVRDALRDIIEGKVVKRVQHELTHEGEDLTSIFIEELERHGTLRRLLVVRTYSQVNVSGFLYFRPYCFFRMGILEQFTSWKIRKLWGSVVKDTRGDWNIQIPATRETIIYANESLKLEMDIEHPPEI